MVTTMAAHQSNTIPCYVHERRCGVIAAWDVTLADAPSSKSLTFTRISIHTPNLLLKVVDSQTLRAEIVDKPAQSKNL